ncbi:MAG: sigma-54-dependent Fis family transcriptional regulator [Myxococcales bacterium]|nr:sigma-54-dependent Fis family transcriptional regulator [Myxococcales bacterium]
MAGETTLSAVPAQPGPGASEVPVLTLALHPDPRRIGERAFLLDERHHLSRAEPLFARPRGDDHRPIDDPHVSRRGLAIERQAGGLRITGSGAVDGEPLDGEAGLELDATALARGVTLALANRVLVLLHQCDPLAPRSDDRGLVGESGAIAAVRRQIARIAPLGMSVLVRGESGTGKELVAQALHRGSPRAAGPFVAVNVAAIPPTMIAAQLFGHRRGAFTGAVDDSPGYFGRAEGGTLFLDEIGDAPDDVQLALLRVLETAEIQPVGAPAPRKVDVRVVAATDADLEARLERGELRRPLYERLRALSIQVAPLRERREDIPRLFLHALDATLGELGHPERLAPTPPGHALWLGVELMQAILDHDWPGNVRELQNLARRLAVEAWDAPTIPPDLLEGTGLALATPPPVTRPSSAPPRRRLEDIAEAELVEALEAADYKTAEAARILGVAKSSLYQLIAKSGLVRKAGDLREDEIREALAASGGDPAAAALFLGAFGLLAGRRRRG